MQKLDLRKEYGHLYGPSARKVEVVDVPEFQFAMIDGAIEPGAEPGTSASFAQALQALYGISYTLKFISKLRPEDPIDYPVMALEGLWWATSGRYDLTRKDDWCWTAMIMQPTHITADLFSEGIAQLRKKRGDSPALALLRLERFHEGPAIQVMHIGPYADEPATIARMDEYAAAHGYRLHGKHHEIYLGDPRRTATDKIKTVLRHPVASA